MARGGEQHYLDYWGFERAPFALTPDPEMLYLSKQHRECMLRLQYAIASNKGGALLVSENPGDGKTSVLKRLHIDLVNSTEERYRVVFIDHPTLTPNQVLWEILRQLGYGDTKGEKVQSLLHLRGSLEEMHERGERVVFILDEGQLLSDRPELLQEFRVLLNYTVGETFLLTFIFSGQAELEATMKRLPELYQRLPVRYFLHSMDPVDTGRMLEHRIRVAGCRDTGLFNDAAVREIYRYSSGIPRVICTVADLSLVVAHSRGVRRITDREVLMAMKDLDRTTQDGYHYYHFLRSAGATTPDEQLEIERAEAEMDRDAAEEAMGRIERAAGPSDRPLPRWSGEGGEPPLEPTTTPEAPLLDRDQPADTYADDWVPTEEGVQVRLEGDSWTDTEAFLASREDLVHCPVCGTRQSADRTACTQCSSPLYWICPSCQYRNTAHQARCSRCGQSMAQAAFQAESALRDAVAGSAAGPEWGFITTPDFSLKLSEGEKVLAVVKCKRTLRKGVKVRARVQAWGERERKADLVVTNHRLHVVGSDLQSRIPFHEIQGLRETKGKLNLFHAEGSLWMEFPASQTEVTALVSALIEFLEFQTGRFKV